MGLPSSHSKQPPPPRSAAEASAEHLYLKDEMVCGGLRSKRDGVRAGGMGSEPEGWGPNRMHGVRAGGTGSEQEGRGPSRRDGVRAGSSRAGHRRGRGRGEASSMSPLPGWPQGVGEVGMGTAEENLPSVGMEPSGCWKIHSSFAKGRTFAVRAPCRGAGAGMPPSPLTSP